MSEENRKAIRISVRNLVEFVLRSGDIDNRCSGNAQKDAMLAGGRIHRKIQKRMGSGYRAEVPLKHEVQDEEQEITLLVEGRADGIFAENGIPVIDEIKGMYTDISRLEEPIEVHLAQAMCYGYFYCCDKDLDGIRLQMTYCNLETEEIKRFQTDRSREELETWFSGVVHEYFKWARYLYHHELTRDASIGHLEFPFPYRAGQRDLVVSVYRTVSRKKRLFIQAPTGIGKTLSTVFPAVRAIGEGKGDKLFYLTAKTVTRTVAEEAFRILRDHGLIFTSVTITAKEKLCPMDECECNPDACPYAKGHFDRVNEAVFDILHLEQEMTREKILQYAEKYRVCPFEYCLDISSWTDGIICDYNYVFDPNVRLKRYFADGQKGDYLFLVDEAHNLPERARAMYSARFCKSSLTEAKRALGRGKSTLKTALSKADKAFLEGRKAVSTLAPRRGSTAAEEDDSGQTSLLGSAETPAIELPAADYAQDGTVFCKELPSALLAPLRALTAPLQDWLEDDPDAEAHAVLLDLYFEVQDILRASERYDEHFAAQLTARGSDLELQLLCLDPSPFVDASLSAGRAAALFSATLTPPGYYRTVLGCPEARAVALESPFPAENLGLYCLPSISTRYRQRDASIRPISDALAALASSRVGNYLAFFPSYAYLRQVWEDFTARYPDIGTLVQESGLDDAGRAAFLGRFSPCPEKTLLGFGVMGGIFGEGVDLAGDRLIGCAIVGVGLPQVSPRQEMLRRYYDAQNGAGFDYAYRWPGMNKVLQAAGRVIRTQEDKGVVLLLDDRFAQSEYARLFPKHWRHLEYLRDTKELKKKLAEFWGE